MSQTVENKSKKHPLVRGKPGVWASLSPSHIRLTATNNLFCQRTVKNIKVDRNLKHVRHVGTNTEKQADDWPSICSHLFISLQSSTWVLVQSRVPPTFNKLLLLISFFLLRSCLTARDTHTSATINEQQPGGHAPLHQSLLGMSLPEHSGIVVFML